MTTKQPEAIELWAVAVNGARYMHDGERPWFFVTYTDARGHIAKHIAYRQRLLDGPENTSYKPLRVRIEPAKTIK